LFESLIDFIAVATALCRRARWRRMGKRLDATRRLEPAEPGGQMGERGSLTLKAGFISRIPH